MHHTNKQKHNKMTTLENQILVLKEELKAAEIYKNKNPKGAADIITNINLKIRLLESKK